MAFNRKRLTVAVVLLGLAIVDCPLVNPLRRSEAGVSSWLAKRTPLGSPLEAVRAVAERGGWYKANLQGSDGKTSGPYIRGELGHYWSVPFPTYVTVFWEFDSSNKLANIRVWKTTDMGSSDAAASDAWKMS